MYVILLIHNNNKDAYVHWGENCWRFVKNYFLQNFPIIGHGKTLTFQYTLGKKLENWNAHWKINSKFWPEHWKFLQSERTSQSVALSSCLLLTNRSNGPLPDGWWQGNADVSCFTWGLPQIPPICHCNYFSISSPFDQDLLSSKKSKLALSMTYASKKTHPALLWVHGKCSERVFNGKEGQAIHLGLLFGESAVKPVNGM